MNGWIRTDDRLPTREEGARVAMGYSGGEGGTDYFLTGTYACGCWWDGDDLKIDAPPRVWMPLPPVPGRRKKPPDAAWIRTADRLPTPEEARSVAMGYRGNGEYADWVAGGYYAAGGWADGADDASLGTPDYWRPLDPLPPPAVPEEAAE